MALDILIVDDEANVCRMLTTAFSLQGHETHSACDSEAGLALFNEKQPDVVLMDIRMPVMDGLEATRRIRTCTHPRGATVPIIAISANAFADDIQKAKNAGMNEHLAKPFEMEKVLRAISRYHKV